MKFGVVVFPGTNGEQDMIHVLTKVMEQAAEKIWYKDINLDNFTTDDCIVLPGGFSFGDYIRPGAIASTLPILQSIKSFAAAGGYVMGISNGFQILCEAGLLPGTLLSNLQQRFICQNVYLKTITSNSPITAAISPDEILKLPIAHNYGRYYAQPETVEELQKQDQILFQYCTKAGQLNDEANPNGSIANIAGVCNTNRNVFGIMPQPERAAEAILGNKDGRALFESLLRTAKTDIKA